MPFPTSVAPSKNCTELIVPSESVADAVSVIVVGSVKVAPFAGAVKLIDGGLFVVTESVIAVEVAAAPRLSDATAVIVCEPTPTLLQITEYGDDIDDPSDVLPLKYSTLVMLPSLSDALAVKLKLPGANALAPLVGDVILTVGNEFEITVIGADVDVAPRLSVATAVIT